MRSENNSLSPMTLHARIELHVLIIRRQRERSVMFGVGVRSQAQVQEQGFQVCSFSSSIPMVFPTS